MRDPHFEFHSPLRLYSVSFLHFSENSHIEITLPLVASQNTSVHFVFWSARHIKGRMKVHSVVTCLRPLSKKISRQYFILLTSDLILSTFVDNIVNKLEKLSTIS